MNTTPHKDPHPPYHLPDLSQNADTIVSLATATPAAIGVIRLSGEKAISAVQTLFTPVNKRPFSQQVKGKLLFGSLVDQEGVVIDQVLATYSKAPHSYTGEDTAEIHCHGSPMVLRLTLEALYALGCRQALPGEFTQRAFLQGKLDLNQAEAVADLLEAKTPSAVRLASSHLQGKLTHKIGGIYAQLSQLVAHFCVVLDYPDEDIDPFQQSELETALQTQKTELEKLLATVQRGKLIAKGIPVALLGLPNAGKSSLLNCLLGYDRAIVTPFAGTTRDTIEEEVSLGTLSLKLIDTAGLRHSDDPVEQLGVQRSRQAQEMAKLHLIVLDGTVPLTGEEPKENPQVPCVCILNKSDETLVIDPKNLDYSHVCCLSAQNGEGIDRLQEVILSLFDDPNPQEGEVLLSNLRQAEQVRLAFQCLEGALDGLASGMSPDGILSDVEGAMKELGILSGRNVQADVTQEIFSRFCVGK